MAVFINDMDNKDYHFYDIEEKHVEGRSLLDNDNLDHTQESHNYLPAVIAGVLGVLLIITSFVLAWIVFSRWHGSSINLSHAIMLTLALLFGAFAAFFAFTLWKNSGQGVAGNANMAFIVYIGSLLFAIYFAVAALYLWVQQQFFSNILKCQVTNVELWESNFWAQDYDAAQLLYWRIYLVLAIFAVLIAVSFAVLAWAAWTVLTNKVQTKKITLGIALIAIVVWGFLIVIWFQDHKAAYTAIQSKLPEKFAYVPFIAFIFAIIALGLAFLNAITNFIHVKTINFIFAIVWVGFFLVFAIFVALLFRNVYNLSKQRPFSAQESAGYIAEKHYNEYCPSKYLDAGQYCGGSYVAETWDRDVNAPAQLNPVCDCNSTDLILWPLYVISIFSAFLLASVAVAVVTNFALASGERDDETYNAFHIFDVIALILIVLLAIALGFWLGFRPAGVNNAYESEQSGLRTDFRGRLVPNESFSAVPESTSQNIDLKDQCYFFGKTQLPNFPQVKDENGGYSVGVLVTNGKINSNYIGKNGQLGPKISRQHFFPNANNSNDDFVNIYGNGNAVSEALRNLVICQTSLQINHGVYLSAIKTDISKISSYSLTGGKAPVFVEPYPKGSLADLSGFNNVVGDCSNSCQNIIAAPVNGYLNIRGSLLIKNAAGQIQNYGVPEANLELNLYHNDNGRKTYLAVGSYDANGNFLIQAPYIQNAAYKAVLHIDDKSGQYQSTLVDILVNPPNTNSDLNAGSVLLATRTGAGCKVADFVQTNNCFALQANAALVDKKLDFVVHDVVNVGEDLSYPLTLTVRKGFSELSPVVHTETLNSAKWSKILPPGNYLVEVEGDGYKKNVQRVTLDSDQVANGYLEKNIKNGYRIYAAIDNTIDPNSDYDLNLKIRNSDGHECVVSPAHRVCPHASHIQSISNAQKGFEVIELSNFTNAYYMVYITKNPSVVKNCPYTSTVSKRFLSKPNNHLVDVLANAAVRVFTQFDQSSLSSDNSALAGSSSYTEASHQMINPIKYGDRPIIPNLLSAINLSGQHVYAKDLFKQYVDNTDSAALFGASLPLLYNQNSIQSQIDGISNANLPSSYVSSFKSYAGSSDNTGLQDYQTSSVFGIINGINDNKNELIREQNNLGSGYSYYDMFSSDQNNSVLPFMSNFAAYESNKGAFGTDSWWNSVNSANANNGKINVVSSESQEQVNNNVVPLAPVNSEVPADVEPVVTPVEPIEEVVTPVETVVTPVEPVVTPVEPVVVEQVVVKPVEPIVQVVEKPVAPVVEEPAKPIAEENNTTAPVLPVPTQSTTNVNASAPEDQNDAVPQEPVQPETNGTQTTVTETNVVIAPEVTTPTSFPDPQVVAKEASPVDYTDAVKPQESYQKIINLNGDGSYPLSTDLLPENDVTSTQQTVVVTQVEPVEEVVEPVEEVVAPVEEVVAPVEEVVAPVEEVVAPVEEVVIVQPVEEIKPVPVKVQQVTVLEPISQEPLPENAQINKNVPVVKIDNLSAPVNQVDTEPLNQAVPVTVVKVNNNSIQVPAQTVADDVPSDADLKPDNKPEPVVQSLEQIVINKVEEIAPANPQPVVVVTETVQEPTEQPQEPVEQIEEPVFVAEKPVIAEEESKQVEEPVVVTQEPVVVVQEAPKQIEEPVVVVQETPKQIEEPAVVVQEPVVVVQEAPNQVEEPVVVVQEAPKQVEEPVVVAEEPVVVTEEVQQEQPEEPVVVVQEPVTVVQEEQKQPAQEPVVIVQQLAPVQEVNEPTVEEVVQEAVQEPVVVNQSPEPVVVEVVPQTDENQSPSILQKVKSSITSATDSISNSLNSGAQTVVEAPSNVVESVQTAANSAADETANAADEVIPDRRLGKGRFLQAENRTYQTQFCFTGFGERSIKQYSKSGTGIPSIQGCVDMYPDNDSYSLKNLKNVV